MSTFAPRRILALIGLLVALGTIVGTANAEPKNEWPFTRPIRTHTLHQSIRHQAADIVATPEAKNELPFTRPIDASTVTKPHLVAQERNELNQSAIRYGVAANPATLAPASKSGGFDWTLTIWITALVATLAGSAFLLARRVQLGTSTPA